MNKDLSKDLYSTTALFEELLPQIVEINKSSDDDSVKKETAINLIVASLCKRRNDDPNDIKGISRDRITKIRNIIILKDDVDGIIRYMQSSIKSGKNYNGGN